VDLKFLALMAFALRNFKSKTTLEFIDLLVRLLNPKFARRAAPT
jgi:hypothetical protein